MLCRTDTRGGPTEKLMDEKRWLYVCFILNSRVQLVITSLQVTKESVSVFLIRGDFMWSTVTRSTSQKRSQKSSRSSHNLLVQEWCMFHKIPVSFQLMHYSRRSICYLALLWCLECLVHIGHYFVAYNGMERSRWIDRLKLTWWMTVCTSSLRF